MESWIECMFFKMRCIPRLLEERPQCDVYDRHSLLLSVGFPVFMGQLLSPALSISLLKHFQHMLRYPPVLFPGTLQFFFRQLTRTFHFSRTVRAPTMTIERLRHVPFSRGIEECQLVIWLETFGSGI